MDGNFTPWTHWAAHLRNLPHITTRKSSCVNARGIPPAVGSTRSAALSAGGEVPHPVLDGGGGGYSIRSWMAGVPIQSWKGGYPIQSWMQSWMGGTPVSCMGTLCLDLGRGYPQSRPGMGYPPSRPGMGTAPQFGSGMGYPPGPDLWCPPQSAGWGTPPQKKLDRHTPVKT